MTRASPAEQSRKTAADRFNADVVDRIRAIVGDDGTITDLEKQHRFLAAWRGEWNARSPLIVLPRNAEQVAHVVKVCVETGTPIVPQGGNTGVTGAAQARPEGTDIVLSLERMNAIRNIDIENATMAVEAGCTLAQVQEAAKEAGLLFPLDIGARDSCQIGGVISTNAGGMNVVRYGMTRNLVAGLEVVLPGGQIWDGMRALVKDNSGLDLKQIFVGAEGTLGIVTAAVLRLAPLPRSSCTALLATPSPADALKWFKRARAAIGSRIESIELMQRLCLDLVLEHIPDSRDPLTAVYPWYLLVRITDPQKAADLTQPLLDLFEAGIEAGELVDGVIASSARQEDDLWRLREITPEAHKRAGSSVKHDVSVPVSRVPAFIQLANARLEQAFPGIRPMAFGHMGDGNLHYNPTQKHGDDPAIWDGRATAITRIVHDTVMELNGSITAEHGVGQLRRSELERVKSAVELDLMRRIKTALDPSWLMNPDKMLRRTSTHRD